MKKIVIFGVGLIGGSVALALKNKHSALHIVGVGRGLTHLQTALDLHVIDEASTDVANALKDADIALIAAPVAQTSNILQLIKPHLEQQTVVTDAGSTKSDVLTCARQILGDKFNQFIGGHPIAGAEKSGAAAATVDLYNNKNVVLTPNEDTPDWVRDKVTQLWQDCGAKINLMSAEQHDDIFASVSHLPHLLAFALVDDFANHENSDQLFNFAASGFRDFSRIAGSHPEMWRDISLANKTAILKSLDSYESTLANMRALLENEDGEGLQATFDRASKARNNWANTQNKAK